MQFPSANHYYQTALHELGHSTGHPERMNRPTLTQGIGDGFGSPAYAKEELRGFVDVERHPGPSFRVLCDIVAPCLHDFAPARQQVRSHVRALGAPVLPAVGIKRAPDPITGVEPHCWLQAHD